MVTTEQTIGLPIREFVDELIADMSMAETDPSEVAELKLAMYEQVDRIIIDALANHLEPEVAEAVGERYSNEPNMDFLLMELLSESPHVQEAIMRNLATMREDMLEINKQLNE